MKGGAKWRRRQQPALISLHQCSQLVTHAWGQPEESPVGHCSLVATSYGITGFSAEHSKQYQPAYFSLHLDDFFSLWRKAVLWQEKLTTEKTHYFLVLHPVITRSASHFFTRFLLCCCLISTIYQHGCCYYRCLPWVWLLFYFSPHWDYYHWKIAWSVVYPNCCEYMENWEFQSCRMWDKHAGQFSFPGDRSLLPVSLAPLSTLLCSATVRHWVGRCLGMCCSWGKNSHATN